MIRLISVFILLCFAWVTTAQALPFPNDSITETSLTAQTAVSLASNKGDLDKSLRSVTSKEAFQSIGIAMVSAGVAQGLNTYFKIPLNPSAITDLTKHAAYHSTAMISNMAAEAAIAGKADGKGAALKAIASTLSSKLANVIGDSNACGEIDFFTHKALHALKGAAEGRIIGGKKGMEAGALGAFIAETVAEAITPTHGIGKMKAKDQPDYSEDRLLLTKNVSKVVAALVAAAAGMDPTQVSIAVLSATTSLDSNFEHSAKGIKDGEKEDEEAELEQELSFISHLQLETGDFGEHDSSGRISPTEDTDGQQLWRKTKDFVKEVLPEPVKRGLKKCAQVVGEKIESYREEGRDALAKSLQGPRGNPLSLSDSAKIILLDVNDGVHHEVEHGKSYARKGLRHVGVPKDIAQDTVSAIGGGANAFFAVKGTLSVAQAVSNVTKSVESMASKSIPLTKTADIGKSSTLKHKMPANASNPLPSAANSNPIPYFAVEAAEVNGIQGLAQQHIGGGSGAAGVKPTTMSGSGPKPLIPATDSIIAYGHVQDQTRKLIDAAVGIKGKESSVLHLTQPTKGLFETANEASAAYKRVQANMASPASVVSGGISNKPSTILGREHPWTIHHEDQLWKTKIVGLPQKTGSKETLTSVLNPHAKESARIAMEIAKRPDVDKVFLNRGIKKASGHPIQGSNRRPDVTYVTKDGKVHQIEVASASDKDWLLLQRMEDSASLLPKERQGKIDVIIYKDYMRTIDK
jgi:hypothetical protein